MDKINDIAGWMTETIKQKGFLDQDDTVTYIIKNYGYEFVNETESGGYSISQKIRTLFQKMCKTQLNKKAEWNKSDMCWDLVDLED